MLEEFQITVWSRMIEIVMKMGSFEYVKKNRCFGYSHKNYYIYNVRYMSFSSTKFKSCKSLCSLVIGFFTMNQDIQNMGKNKKKHKNETVFRFIWYNILEYDCDLENGIKNDWNFDDKGFPWICSDKKSRWFGYGHKKQVNSSISQKCWKIIAGIKNDWNFHNIGFLWIWFVDIKKADDLDMVIKKSKFQHF